MNLKEIKAKYQPRQLDNQCEFDRMMSTMNNEQTELNHPLIDRERELTRQREMLMTQKSAINIQLNQIKMERLSVEQERKDINRTFHELKHQLIMLNPRENYVKSAESVES